MSSARWPAAIPTPRGRKSALELAPLDLPETITHALAVLESQAQKKELHIHMQLPPDLAALSADARKVKQILYNLLSNAIRYTPEQGSIHIAVFDDQREVRVEVADSGRGITPQDQQLLFQPYMQLNELADKADGEGTGLGLAITKQLVELHGGHVWLESEVGRGSTFGFSLPRVQKPFAHLAPEASHASG